MSMAHGIEGRFPFLDHRVIEFATGLPSHFKMKALNEKYVLKRATAHLVPRSIIRRHKQPFRAPDARCFFPVAGQSRQPDYVGELLSSSRLAEDGLFNAAAVQRLVTKARAGHELGVRDNMSLLGVLSTQILVDRFIRTAPNARH
jgi:asparagine synthase (glutamine-hydrolysing)